jgi:glycosyltransferase involved in cell wall biosynthesis
MSANRRLRIAVLNRHFGYRFGGAERYAAAVVEALAARHEVHVFAQEIEHAWPGVSYHRVSRPIRKPRWLNQLWFAFETWRQTRKGFDVVHSHENTWHGDLQTVHVRPFRTGLFHNRHGLRRTLKWVSLFTSPRLLTYWCLEAARFRPRAGKCMVATSAQVQDEIVHAYPAAAACTQVIAPGVNPPDRQIDAAMARQQLGLPAQRPLALFVGNDYAKKGLATLLQALVQVPGLDLAVAGSAQHIPAFERQAQQLGLAGRLHFLGSLPDVSPAYCAADLLVHPTTEDTYAMVVLEAMAHGLPVIVSGIPYCGIAAELRHGHDALILSDPRDADGLAQHLQQLLASCELQETLKTAGLAFAQQRSWSAVADQHDALLQKLGRHTGF